MNTLSPRLAGRWLANSERQFPLISWLLILALNIYLLILPLETFIVQFSIGDGLVFPMVAFHIARGLGSTYDGITQTNGYHPLWLWLHVPLMVGATSVFGRLALARLLWVATSLAAIAVWSLLVYRVTRNALATAVFTLLMGGFGWTIYVFYSGVETPLVILLVGLCLLLADPVAAGTDRSPKRLAWLGLIMGLTFLSRLDSIFLLIPLGLLILSRLLYPSSLEFLRVPAPALPVQVPPSSPSYILITIWLLAAVPLPLLYLLSNRLLFGSFMPVSGQVKILDDWNIGRSLDLTASWLAKIDALLPNALHWPAVIVALLLAAGAGWLAWWLLRRQGWQSRPRFHVLWLLPLAAIGQYAYYFFKVRELNVPWHLYFQFQTVYLLAGLVAAYALEFIRQRLKGGRSQTLTEGGFYLVSLLCLVAVTLFYAQLKSVRRPEVALALQTGRWVEDNLPAGSTLAMYDSFYVALTAGSQHFIDLNGLTGNEEIAELARIGDYRTITERYDVAYVVTNIRGECALDLDAWLPHLYQSPLQNTTGPLRMAVIDSNTYRNLWEQGCYAQNGR